ncbi:MAG: CopG family transcriptional regulator [Candidatus Bipolaricaulia bacterium]
MFGCMRTTITLDDDVAALLKRLQASSQKSLKELINTALRKGLAQLEEPSRARRTYVVRPLSVGRCQLSSLDDVAEALAVAEGEALR